MPAVNTGFAAITVPRVTARCTSCYAGSSYAIRDHMGKCTWLLCHRFRLGVSMPPSEAFRSEMNLHAKLQLLHISQCYYQAIVSLKQLIVVPVAATRLQWESGRPVSRCAACALTQTGRAHPMGSDQKQSDRPDISTQACKLCS